MVKRLSFSDFIGALLKHCSASFISAVGTAVLFIELWVESTVEEGNGCLPDIEKALFIGATRSISSKVLRASFFNAATEHCHTLDRNFYRALGGADC